MGKLIFTCYVCCVLQIVSAYWMEVSVHEEAQFCSSKSHQTFKPTVTCCSGQVIHAGIKFKKFWNPCSDEVNGKSSTIEDIGWDLYGCILRKNHPDVDELSLLDYAHMMTRKYPEEIKTKILAEVDKQSIENSTFTDFTQLGRIRNTYYDIENAVCSGTVSDGKEYGKVEEKCAAWKEEHHRSGMCCKKAYPVDLFYNSVMELDFDTSDKILTTCRDNKLHEELEMFGSTPTIESNLMDICTVACKMNEMNLLDIQTDIVLNIKYLQLFNLKDELQKRRILPRVLQGGSIESEAMKYVMTHYSLENSIKAMKEYEFADVIDAKSGTERPENFHAYVQLPYNKSEGFKFEFMRRKFHDQIIHIPILCSAYSEIATLMEHSVYQARNVAIELLSKPIGS